MEVEVDSLDPVKGDTFLTESGRLLYCWYPAGWKYIPPADVLTSGYGNRPVAQLVALVNRFNCFVADIRLDPRSERPEWSKENLTSLLGGRYAHIPELGNLNHAVYGAGIDINNMDRGVKLVKRAVENGRWLLLLCACGKRDHCHRAVVARALNAEGLTTSEVYEWPIVPLEGLQ